MIPSQKQLALVKQRIKNAALIAGRLPSDVNLIVVSKTFDIEDIIPILESGHRVFGENRVQEAMSKWPQLRKRYPDIELHLIGPLQTNKVGEAVSHFDVIQTLDRPKLLTALTKEMEKQGAKTKMMIQVNTGREPQKAGLSPEDLAQFVELARGQLQNQIIGFMCIPPVDANPKTHFKMLQSMAQTYRLPQLSMGMSSDYEVAIAEGATFVRVGSAIFGTRPKPVQG